MKPQMYLKKISGVSCASLGGVAKSGLMFASLALSSAAQSVQCSLNVQSINFGGYDVFYPLNLDGTGNISVSCDFETAYSLTLSQGYGSFNVRKLISGTNYLNYNIYTNDARTVVWGDGNSGTVVVSNTGLNQDHTVYGRIPALQNVPLGVYIDVVMVTINY